MPVSEFNSYGSRRGNHEVMMRGTFANIRIRNEMLDGVEGGYTLGPDGEQTSIYDAAMAWQAQGVPLVVIAGKEYGTGSSRDWAAKGTMLLGVKAVIAESFERIHRSNLVGMGVIPLEFTGGDDRKTLGLKGDETISIGGLAGDLKPLAEVPATIAYGDGTAARDQAQVPDRYRGRDRVRRERRRAALRAAQPRQGGLTGAAASGPTAGARPALEGLTRQRSRRASRSGRAEARKVACASLASLLAAARAPAAASARPRSRRRWCSSSSPARAARPARRPTRCSPSWRRRTG